MCIRRDILASLLIFAVSVAVFSGCSFEPGERSQLAGQECFSDNQCADGLVCLQRICRPESAVSATDAGADSDADVDVDVDADAATDVPPDNDAPPTIDVGQECQPGETRCTAGTEMQRCGNDGTWQLPQSCGQGDCVDGRCHWPNCDDNDGDGYGVDCQAGPDCDDTDPAVFPSARERCNTPYDDNCDGQVNEACTECCPGGCGADEVCSGCRCLPDDPDRCTRQDQRCTEEGPDNGFWCTDLGSSSAELRCKGICDRTADDPDSTCPEPGSICAFGEGDQGVCLSGCTLSQGCGVSDQGCLAIDGQPREGLCVPTNPTNQVGDRCNSDEFFDCEEGAFCINLQTGSRCVEGCRPYSRAFDDGTDCSSGHCVPLTDTIGMCRPDAANSTAGDSCRSRHIFRACNQDATGCFPSGGFQGPQCYRICRLQEGNTDCPDGQNCTQYDSQRDDVGLCQ